jgi:tRNA (mo5U34)-methyltransferase
LTLQSRAGHDTELQALAPWFHNLHLPDGRQTAPDHPLGDFPSFKWREIAPYIPDDLHGWTALDIGCNAGLYTFELAARGAQVTGLDSDEHYLRQARWAAGQFGLSDSVEFRHGSVYELARSQQSWDLVLFMGVLYHLRYPQLALDAVAQRARRLLVLQTLTVPGEDRIEVPADLPFAERARLAEPGWPKAAFVEHRLADDPTNWWVPTGGAAEAMARSAGLEILGRPGPEIWLCRPDGTFTGGDELRAAAGDSTP